MIAKVAIIITLNFKDILNINVGCKRLLSHSLEQHFIYKLFNKLSDKYFLLLIIYIQINVVYLVI